MYNVPPPAPFSSGPTAPANVHSCAIVDASSLLYQPALRAAVVQEQVALLATRLAVARWTSGTAAPAPSSGQDAQPFRAAFYARAQQDFFAWIERGGMWAADGEDVVKGEHVVCDVPEDGNIVD
jgi:hypothetical protein